MCIFFYSTGINQWRDQQKPSQILQDVARLKGVPQPVFSDSGNRVNFAGREYLLDNLGEWLYGTSNADLKSRIGRQSSGHP